MSFASKDSRHRGWWGYMKWCIRKYDTIAEPRTELERRELEAVDTAIEHTRSLTNGESHLELVRLIYWKRSHNVPGAAMALHVSERTALRWHGDFIKAVALAFFGPALTDPPLY